MKRSFVQLKPLFRINLPFPGALVVNFSQNSSTLSCGVRRGLTPLLGIVMPGGPMGIGPGGLKL